MPMQSALEPNHERENMKLEQALAHGTQTQTQTVTFDTHNLAEIEKKLSEYKKLGWKVLWRMKTSNGYLCPLVRVTNKT